MSDSDRKEGKMKRRRITKEERKKIYNKYGGHCAYCGCKIEYKGMQVDHVVPLAKGGKDEEGNMLPSCRSCNHYKATLTAEEFREYVAGIPKRLKRDSIPYQVGVRFGMIKANSEVKFYFEKRGEDMTEIDCRKCENCTGAECLVYGKDANIAVKKCAADVFKNYRKRREEEKK